MGPNGKSVCGYVTHEQVEQLGKDVESALNRLALDILKYVRYNEVTRNDIVFVQFSVDDIRLVYNPREIIVDDEGKKYLKPMDDELNGPMNGGEWDDRRETCDS